MARVNTSIGDVFCVKVDDSGKKYFQLIAFDSTQLNSDVIRAFKKVYPLNADIELSEIVSGEVEFYAHCVTKLGLKMKVWEKVGNIMVIGDTTQILFRGTDDYGSKTGEDPIKKSNKWYVWRINGADFTQVGKLEGQNRKAFIGLVINPLGILELIRGNKYPINYPEFE